ncbi:PAS domain-containing protein [Chryseobacterium lacus]|uniref:PAS domain-containing protein n=1 Tax=Chryseobacterium lacus TaxID=2058346 RepID=UPI000F86201B|nr:PAS domain-containing protein [Chryseobacterium lacus]RST26818.1 PAS domain S-box protein [Chryseobacterium lacus]
MKNFLENNQLKPETLIELFGQAPVALAVLKGKDMIVEASNSLMLKYMGVNAEVIGRPIYEVQPLFNSPKFRKILLNVYENGVIHTGHEKRMTLIKNGAELTSYYDFTYSPLKNTMGEITGIITIANDVTEQVLAKQENEKIEARFRNLIMEAEIPTIFFKGKELIIDIINEKAKEYWKEKHDLSGLPLREALPAVFAQPFAEILKNVYRTGKIYKEDAAKIMIPQGDEFQAVYMNLSFKPIYDSSGEIFGVLNMSLDVTEQINAKKLIEKSEERLRQFIAAVPLAMSVLKGPEFTIEMSNRGVSELWEKNNRRIGKTLIEAYPELENHFIIGYLKQAYETGRQIQIKEIEVKLPHFEKPRYMNYIFTPIDVGETERTIVSVGYDITEEIQLKRKLQESELRFKNLADTIPQIVWTAKPDGEVDYFNERWYELSGLPKDEIHIKNWKEIVHKDDLKNIEETWKRNIETGELHEVEYRLEKKDNPGTYHWYLGRGIPIKSDDGKILKWIGSTTDIHEFKTFLKQKDDFLAITSHELKTPLTSIKLYAQALERMLKQEGYEKGAEYAGKMGIQINRLNQLITDLLDVTKIQNGQLPLNKTVFDFDDLVSEVAEEAKISNGNHKIISKLGSTGLVEGDRERIQQVMQNFISNAIKYSPNKEKIVICSHTDEEGNACFSVEDFGIGIPKNKIEKIFEQFYRVNEESSNTFEGMGLGLYISSQIIKRSEGKIKVQSELGKGSKFSFCLPKKNL